MKEPVKYYTTIQYVEDWEGRGEHYVFTTESSKDHEPQFNAAFPLLDYDGEKGVVVRYEMINHIRLLKDLGHVIYFG